MILKHGNMVEDGNESEPESGHHHYRQHSLGFSTIGNLFHNRPPVGFTNPRSRKEHTIYQDTLEFQEDFRASLGRPYHRIDSDSIMKHLRFIA